MKPLPANRLRAFANRIRTSAEQDEICMHLTALALRLRKSGAEKLAAQALIVAVAGARKDPVPTTIQPREKPQMPAPRLGGFSIRRSACR